MAEFSVGEVARQAGIRPSALRYYESIGLPAVDFPALEDRQDDEDASIGRINASKRTFCLQGWDHAIGCENNATQLAKQDASPFAQQPPNQLPSPDM